MAADDGDTSSGPLDASGGQGAADEADGLGLGAGAMLLNVGVLVAVAALCVLVYRRWGRRLVCAAARDDAASALPKMRRRDFTLEQLREYDGVRSPRILMAVNMKVFDVTTGRKFYGKGESGGSVRFRGGRTRAHALAKRGRAASTDTSALRGRAGPEPENIWVSLA